MTAININANIVLSQGAPTDTEQVAAAYAISQSSYEKKLKGPIDRSSAEYINGFNTFLIQTNLFSSVSATTTTAGTHNAGTNILQSLQSELVSSLGADGAALFDAIQKGAVTGSTGVTDFVTLFWNSATANYNKSGFVVSSFFQDPVDKLYKFNVVYIDFHYTFDSWRSLFIAKSDTNINYTLRNTKFQFNRILWDAIEKKVIASLANQTFNLLDLDSDTTTTTHFGAPANSPFATLRLLGVQEDESEKRALEAFVYLLEQRQDQRFELAALATAVKLPYTLSYSKNVFGYDVGLTVTISRQGNDIYATGSIKIGSFVQNLPNVNITNSYSFSYGIATITLGVDGHSVYLRISAVFSKTFTLLTFE